MPSPRTKVVADTPIRRVLATVERLVGQVDALDLDFVDGEFYWRCCHPTVLPLVDELRRIRESGAVRYLDDEEDDSEERATILRNTPATRWRPYADETSWRAYRRFSEVYEAAARIIPERMVGEMIDQDLVTMHPPTSRSSTSTGRGRGWTTASSWSTPARARAPTWSTASTGPPIARGSSALLRPGPPSMH